MATDNRNPNEKFNQGDKPNKNDKNQQKTSGQSQSGQGQQGSGGYGGMDKKRDDPNRPGSGQR